MSVQETILNYLSVYGKDNKYKMSRALKIDVSEVTEALDVLEKEGKIEIKEGNAMLVKGKEPIIEAEQEDEISIQKAEVEEEQPKTEVSEESIEEKPTEEAIEEEKFKGTVKFYNLNKGFGYISGDDGKDYRVHESGLKESVTIEANDRVSFKVVIGFKGPEAVDVEKISEDAGVQKILVK